MKLNIDVFPIIKTLLDVADQNSIRSYGTVIHFERINGRLAITATDGFSLKTYRLMETEEFKPFSLSVKDVKMMLATKQGFYFNGEKLISNNGHVSFVPSQINFPSWQHVIPKDMQSVGLFNTERVGAWFPVKLFKNTRLFLGKDCILYQSVCGELGAQYFVVGLVDEEKT